MPQLIMKGIKAEALKSISTELVDELQQLLQCPREYFSLELLSVVFIDRAQVVDGNAMIEVKWFDRGQEIQDQMAAILTKHMNSAGYQNVDVYFSPILKSNYYENGIHY